MTRKPSYYQAERFRPAAIDEDPQKTTSRYGTVEQTSPPLGAVSAPEDRSASRPRSARAPEIEQPLDVDPYGNSIYTAYKGPSARFQSLPGYDDPAGDYSLYDAFDSSAAALSRRQSYGTAKGEETTGRRRSFGQNGSSSAHSGSTYAPGGQGKNTSSGVRPGPGETISVGQRSGRTMKIMAKISATAVETGAENNKQTQQGALHTHDFFHAIKRRTAAVKKAAQRSARRISGAAAGKAASSGSAKAITALVATIGLPMTLVLLLILPLFLILMVFSTGYMSRSEPSEINEAYLYITQLDAEMEQSIRQIGQDGIETIYFVNGSETPIDNIQIRTDADYLLLYLDSKHEAPGLSKPIYGAFGGLTVQKEISLIHERLYSYTIVKKTEDGDVISDTDVDPEGDEAESIGWQEVNITMGSTKMLIKSAGMISKDVQDIMDLSTELGVYAYLTTLVSPFKGAYYVMERWGWYVDSSNHLQRRTGVLLAPLAIDSGTVYSCTTGTVDAVTPSSVTVSYGASDTVYYGQLTSISVTAGQELDLGDPIGAIDPARGLELQYSQGGTAVNPVFYLQDPNAANSPADLVISADGFCSPLGADWQTRVTSEFGYRDCPFHGWELHSGLDMAAPEGTPIRAALSGTVIKSYYSSSYGNYTVIAHENGITTGYAHQSQRLVSVGDTVEAGDVIGLVGSTGDSTGPHLHFEVRVNSELQNPRNYLP